MLRMHHVRNRLATPAEAAFVQLAVADRDGRRQNPDDPHDQLDHRGRAGHLKVEAGGDALAQAPDIAFLDVAAVFAQMHSDALGAGTLGEQREHDGIGLDHATASVGLLAIAGLAEGGGVVDVESE